MKNYGLGIHNDKIWEDNATENTLKYFTIYLADLPNWTKYLGYLKNSHCVSLICAAVCACHQRLSSKHTHLEKIHCDIKPYKMTLWLWHVILIMTSGMSRQDIERHFERALPFLVGCLSVLVALLLPLVISTYIQISSKGKFLGYM